MTLLQWCQVTFGKLRNKELRDMLEAIELDPEYIKKFGGKDIKPPITDDGFKKPDIKFIIEEEI